MKLSLLLMGAADSVQLGLWIILILGGQFQKISNLWKIGLPIGLPPLKNLYNPKKKKKNQNPPIKVVWKDSVPPPPIKTKVN